MLKASECGLSAAAVEAGIAYLTERPAKKFYANADFSMIDAKGKRKDHDNHACHGSMNGVGYELIATVSNWATYRYTSYVDTYSKGPYDKKLPTAIGERFYDWLVNRSWAAEYIIAPDQGFATYSGFMVSTSVPANYVLAIMTMSRNCQEQAHNVHRMYDYVDEFGIDEDLAYFLAFGIYNDNKYGTILSGHNIIERNHGFTALDNWMNRRIQQTNNLFSEDNNKYGVTAMWGAGERGNVADTYERFKNVVEAGSVVIPNPFKPVVKASKAVSEEFLRDIIPNLAAHFGRDEQRKAA